jgi:hypothetical protein
VEKRPLENLEVDGRIIFKCIFKKENSRDVNWVFVAEDENKWLFFLT